MANEVSILDVVKRGGYEASLITTFNATLPFYEEVVLRRLIAAGSRYNVVLMDAAQCAQAWASEASRPRLAGHAYTLVPMKTAGAFHPKVCLLAGPKKASVLIGSHNLTLSGFGYNREISNWIEVGGVRDAEGVAALADTWGLIDQWVNQQRANLPGSIIDSVLALSNFVLPLTQKTKASGESGVLGQAPGGSSLLEQVAGRVLGRVLRIVVMGAFFDAKCELLRELERRWPKATVTVLIDPETVHLDADVEGLRSAFVSAREAWPESKISYLHAKAIYFETDAGDVLVSGSANPSRPAWMASAGSGNVEVVYLQVGAEARISAQSLELTKAFACEALDLTALKCIVDRSKAEGMFLTTAAEAVCVAVSDVESDSIRLSLPAGFKPVSVTGYCTGEGQTSLARFSIETAGLLRVQLDVQITQVRSLVVCGLNGSSLRALVHHPDALNGLSQSKRQTVLREALGALGAGEGDLGRLIATVEKVIFSDDAGSDMRVFAHMASKDEKGIELPVRPESLGVHVADMPKQRKKLRLLKSGDLAYLLDVLIRRLALEPDEGSKNRDDHGRSEEELVGQDDETPPDAPQASQAIDDNQIAEIVARKARTLVRRMIGQLKIASNDDNKAGMAIVQLVAVLALLRELRRLRLAPRWRLKQSFVNEVDRRTLLDGAMAWLFGRNSMALSKLVSAADEPLEEVSYLRSLLLWLAWDLGEELTDRISPLMDADESMGCVRSNAILFELFPSTATDPDELAELERSIRMTVMPTGEEAAKAAAWLARHLDVGIYVLKYAENAANSDVLLRVGQLASVPGANPLRRRVITSVVDNEFSVWEFDGTRSFVRQRSHV